MAAKKLFLAVSAAAFLGCPQIKVKPNLAVNSALYSDMQVLRDLNVNSIIETKYSVVEKSGELGKGEFKYSEEIVFNDKDGLAIMNGYNEKGILNWKRTFAFDSTNLTEVRTDSSDGSLLSRITYFYNENGNLLEINEYAKDYTPLYKTSYWYDQSKNMLVINDYSCDFKVGEKPPLNHERKLTHNLDQQGKVTKTRYYSKNDSLVSEKSYSYNDSGYVITEKYIIADSVNTTAHPVKIIYHYDMKDRLLKKDGYTANDQLMWETTYKYEFDKNDLWVKQTEFYSLPGRKESPVAITEREIKFNNNQ